MLRAIATPQSRPPPQMMALISVQKSRKAETLITLCHDFNIIERVLKLFLDAPTENLEEFRFYFHKEDHTDKVVA
eukprot:616862-Karenia_brevis.AAC.1